MNITTDKNLLPKITFQRLCLQGFLLARRNWPFVVWAYAINLVFGLLVAVPFHQGLSTYLDHSLAAQKIAGTVELGSFIELAIHLHEAHFFSVAQGTATWLNLLQLLVLFFLFAGTVFVYISGEPPHGLVLLRGGVAYFWRFVRATILAGCVAGLILGVLLMIRAALLTRLTAVYFERPLFLWAVISGAVVFVIALALRLWFDLVEVYVVRNAMEGELRVHRSLLPACKLMFRYFFRIFGSFFAVGLAGVSSLALCLWLWKALPAGQVWIAILLAQLGLFLLLATRFWQRGLEAALLLATDPPIMVTKEVVKAVEEEAPSLVGVAGVAGLSEPTLSELVQKLRTQPWPALPPPPMLTPENEAGTEGRPPAVSALDRHAEKFPLGGVSPAEEAPPGKSGETPPVVSENDAPSQNGKPPS